jgi:antitoxin component YwqK of YwqJK toxin-antitoxin module
MMSRWYRIDPTTTTTNRLYQIDFKYYNNSQPRETIERENGVVHGYRTIWFKKQTTQLFKMMTQYKNGKRHGVEHEWHSNGMLKAVREFNKGFINGQEITYDRKGNTISSQRWANGTRYSENYYYY